MKLPDSSRRRRVTRIRVACALLAASFLFTSCPNPVPPVLANQIVDVDSPQISVTSPSDGDVYQSHVILTGKATDNDGAVQSVEVSIPVLDLIEEITFEDDGSFTYAFSTVDVTSSIAITITAADWNGNESIKVVILENDLTGPYIEIAEPGDYSTYSTVVRVSGVVADEEGRGSIGEVRSGTYQVLGTSLSAPLSLASDGTFTFYFATRLDDGTQVIDGPATIKIVAEDWNGNLSAEEVTVINPDAGDFASISVVSANKQVTISWSPVLNAESYSIHNPRYGKIRENVTSPYVWDGLVNGEFYSFLLQAVIPDTQGADAWSVRQDVIPLSKRTLAPWVIETRHRSIAIGWKETDPPSECIVERSVDGGIWEVRTLTSYTTFTDTDLTHDSWYSYRIKSTSQPDIVSASINAVPSRFPDIHVENVGPVDQSAPAYKIAVSSSYAYAAAAHAGLQVLDISDPGMPTVVTSCDTPGKAMDVALSGDGNYAYVADYEGGLQVIDISSPDSPSLVGGIGGNGDTTFNEARGVALSDDGDYAYIACRDDSLKIVDITTPDAPTLISTYNAGKAMGLTVSGSHLYVTSETYGLIRLDISSPDDPQADGSVNITTGNSNEVDVIVSSDHAYVAAEYHALQIVDITTTPNPTLMGSVEIQGYAFGVALSDDGNFAYVAAMDGGLAVVDVSDPSAPVSIDHCDNSNTGYVSGVAVAGSYVYVADYGNGIYVMDITRPGSPTLAGSHATAGHAEDVAVSGSYAFVAQHGLGLQIFDISVPTALSLSGVYDTEGAALGVAVAGDFAYVAQDSWGLAIIDVSDPSSPTLAGSCDTPRYARGIAVRGAYAYMGGHDGGFQIVDISDPSSPILVNTLNSDGYVKCPTISGSYAFAPNGIEGLQIIDISEQPSLSLADEYLTPSPALDVDVLDNIACIASKLSGLVLLDVSNPTQASFLGRYDEPPLDDEFAQGVVAISHYAFVADRDSGLLIIDIADPTNPALIAQYDSPGNAEDVAIAGSYAFLADGSGGLRVVKLTGP
jgi:hypothetical protein